MVTISFVGLGVVGLVTQACFASRGINTIGVDASKHKLDILRSGNLPFYEPNLKELICDACSNLTFSDSVRHAVENSNITFVTVGTPSKADGSIDLLQISEASKAIGVALSNKSRYHVVVIKSTVLPGTTDNVIKAILERESRKSAEKDFGLIVNPEFLREGSSVYDTFNPHLLVVGATDNRSGGEIERLWKKFFNNYFLRTIRTNRITAELIKYANNAFLATKISFINSIANLCQRIDSADVKEVAQAIGTDPRIGPLFLNAGPGYGGSCLPKDVKALIKMSHFVSCHLPLLMAVDEVNENQPKQVIELARNMMGGLKGKTVAILGVAFKKDTDDIREAPSIKVIRQLIEHQAIVRATDPLALENLKKIFDDKIAYVKNKFDCLSNADCCIILTEWDEYKNIKAEDFIGYMKKPCIVDARRILDPQEFVVATNYSAIGLKPSYKETIPYREEHTSEIDLDMPLNAIRKEGVLIAENERYTIHDLKLDELTVSLTELKKAQETRGHSHADCSEVYFFTQGDGKIQVGNRTYYVGQGSVITVPRSEFHKVSNLGEQKLIFITVFEGKRFSKNYDYENKASLKSTVAEAH